MLTFGTLALAVRFVVCGADPASLPGQHLEDKCLHYERYDNLKDNHRHDVETKEVDPCKPVLFNLGGKSFLQTIFNVQKLVSIITIATMAFPYAPFLKCMSGLIKGDWGELATNHYDEPIIDNHQCK